MTIKMDRTKILLLSLFGVALVLQFLQVLYHIADIEFFDWALKIQTFAGFPKWISIHKNFIYLGIFFINIAIFISLIIDKNKYIKETFMYLIVISLIFMFVEIYFLSGLLFLAFAILIRFLFKDSFIKSK